MKKIISTFLAALMVTSFAVTSYAEVTFTVNTPVVVPETTTAVADVVIDVSDVTVPVFSVQLVFDLPTGVTLTSYDATELTSLYTSGALNEDNLDIGQISLYEDSMATDVSSVDTITIPVTFTVPAMAKGTSVVIPLNAESTNVVDSEGNQLSGAVTQKVIVAAATTENKSTYEEGCGTYVQGFLVDCAVSNGDDDTAVKSATFKINDNGDVADAIVSLPTAIKNGTIRLAVNVLDVPEATTLALDGVVLSAN